MEGIRFLWELRDTAEVSIVPSMPRKDAETVLIEVYPSGAVKDLGMKGSRAPSRPGEVRARPAAFRPFLSFDHACMEATACTLEDARDACIACLVAYLCRDDLDQPYRLDRVPRERVELEGWIYRAPAALGGDRSAPRAEARGQDGHKPRLARSSRTGLHRLGAARAVAACEPGDTPSSCGGIPRIVARMKVKPRSVPRERRRDGAYGISSRGL